MVLLVEHKHRMQEYSKWRAYQTLSEALQNHKLKNRRNKFFIMLKRISLALQNWHLSKVRTGLLYIDFDFSLKEHYYLAYHIGADCSDRKVPT